MDQFTHTLVPFPLLASHSDYFPDTQDLTVDTEARDYWLKCFEDGLDKVSFATLLGLLRNYAPAKLLSESRKCPEIINLVRLTFGLSSARNDFAPQALALVVNYFRWLIVQ